MSEALTPPGRLPGKLIVEADGGSRGNPGPAAYGAVVRDAATGAVLAELADYLGTETNNFAEYSGILAGLQAAAQINPQATVEARLDSKLVVEQLSGRWAIKNAGLRPLALRAKALAPPDRVSFKWVPRAENKRADALVNKALDAKAAGRPAKIAEFAAEDQETDILTTVAESVGSAARAEAAAREGESPNVIIGWAGPDLAAPTRLIAVRHGVTQHSVEHRFSGAGGYDPPLIEAGRRQAQAAAVELAVRGGADVVVCSPLLRARQTAQVIADHLGLQAVEVVAELAEANFGKWEGLTFSEVKARYPAELTAWLASPEVPAPGGESYAKLRARVARGRHALVAAYPHQRVIAVAHVSPIKALVQTVLEAPSASAFRIELAPCSLTTLAYWGDGVATIYGVGETGHLHDLLQPGV
ncbi:MAG: bifunctional RNase H/acid phosphatase [Candidatus Nanopelagicales bacterium]